MPRNDERKNPPSPTAHPVIGLPRWWTETATVFGPLLGGKTPEEIGDNLADFGQLEPEERQGWLALLAYRQLFAQAETVMWLQRLDSRIGRAAGVSRKQLGAVIRLLQEEEEEEEEDAETDDEVDDGEDEPAPPSRRRKPAAEQRPAPDTAPKGGAAPTETPVGDKPPKRSRRKPPTTGAASGEAAPTETSGGKS